MSTYYLISFTVILTWLSGSFSCHFGEMITTPESATIAYGSYATFRCHGRGSYLYWFINGINTKDMSTDELNNRGISFSGYYNYGSIYSGECTTQNSNLTMASNCMNDNSEIYCVVFGHREPPFGGMTKTESVKLIVEGSSPPLSDLKVFANLTNLFITWNLQLSDRPYPSFSLNITNVYEGLYSYILPNYTTAFNFHLDKPNVCDTYNITLSTSSACSGSLNALTCFKTDEPVKASAVSTKISSSNMLYMDFEIQEPNCTCKLPDRVELLLTDSQSTTHTSSHRLWENINITSNGLYQIQLTVSLITKSVYKLFIITQNELGLTTSEPHIINTFDIQECSYEMKKSLLCVTCTLSAESHVDDFIASVLLHINNLKSSTLKLLKTDMTSSDGGVQHKGCFSVVENGTYVLSIYDWNDASEINIRPAVVEKLIVSQVTASETKSTVMRELTPTQNDFAFNRQTADIEDSSCIILSSMLGIIILVLYSLLFS